LIVQVVNGEKVVFFEGIYYPIVNADEVDVWDNVRVVKVEGNKVVVEKIM
jgi:membrane protein implicated in regulation of membrane protease activity